MNKICGALALWIKNNFSSAFLPYVFRVIIQLYEEVGFTIDFDVDGNLIFPSSSLRLLQDLR